MDIAATSFLLLAIPPTAAAVLLLSLLWCRRGRRPLPPGPWGVPLLGSLPFLRPQLHRYFADIANTFGPVSSLRLGTKLHVIISSPSAAMEIFKVHDTVFANRAVPVVAFIHTDGEDILWAPHGPHWRMVRKVAVSQLLNNAVITSFQPLRMREICRMIGELQSKVGTVVSIRDALYSTTLNVMLGMIWEDALNDDASSDVKKELLEVLDAMIVLLGSPNISDFLPLLAPLDLQGMQRKMKILSARFGSIFDSIVTQRASSCSKPDDGGGVRDFLQLLLDLVHKKDLEMQLQYKHVKGILTNLIAAGTDTTATTVEWAMSELLRHPAIMAKAREELDSVVGKCCVLEESHAPKLKYVDAVVKETLRLHPVLPILVSHSPSRTCCVQGYTIPAGATVFVNVWAIQRDPSVWEEPLEFRPERFLEERSRWDYSGRSFDYLPFGGGKRICAGIGLGERMVKLLLGSLLHSLEWRLPPGVERVEVVEGVGIVMKKKEPLALVPISKIISTD